MAPPQQPTPTAKPAVTSRSKPGKEEVKVSVVNICGPFSADRPANNQSMPAGRILHQRPKPSVSNVTTQASRKTVSLGMVAKEPQTPNATLRTSPWLNKDIVSRGTGSFTKHLMCRPPRLRPLCWTEVSSSASSALEECLIIRPVTLHNPIQRKTPASRAA